MSTNRHMEPTAHLRWVVRRDFDEFQDRYVDVRTLEQLWSDGTEEDWRELPEDDRRRRW